MLLAWSVYVTKERQLAHVIFGTTPSFVSHVVYSFRDIHNNVNFIEVWWWTCWVVQSFPCKDSAQALYSLDKIIAHPKKPKIPSF